MRARTALSSPSLPLCASSASCRSASAAAADSSILASAILAPSATALATSAPGGPPLGPRQCPAGRLPLRDCRRGQRVRAAGDRPLPLLDGPDLEPGLHLGAARGNRVVGELLPPGRLAALG